jgi:hypothetical protein
MNNCLNKFLKYTIVLLVLPALLFAGNDRLLFKNGNEMSGEIKQMDLGVATVKTDYSNTNFLVKWKEVRQFSSHTRLLVGMENGYRYIGYIVSAGDDKVYVVTSAGDSILLNIQNIVYMNRVEKGFWGRLSGTIDVGFDLAKANTMRQFSVNGTIDYIADNWWLDASYNSIFSKQDSIEPVNRKTGNISYYYFLIYDWFSIATVALNSNTETQLKLRTNGNLGFGNYLANNNRIRWSVSAGATFNIEKYYTAINNRNSWEGFIGSNINIYGVHDFIFTSGIIAYPGITEKGRWRFDYNINTKYKFVFDFYITIGFSFNFDNQPVNNAPRTDYALTTGLGWKWNK